MTNQEAQQTQGLLPAQLELEFDLGDAYRKYMLYSKAEILFVLRAALQKGSLVTVYIGQGQSFLLTTILAIDADTGIIIFDMGRNEEINQRALKANQLLFTTSLDNVKVQFSLKALEQIKYGGRTAFRGAIPANILRLQRRDYYRLSTPIASPIRCKTVLRSANRPAKPIEIPLLDISGGGVCLMVAPTLHDEFKPETRLMDCRMDLPDEGQLVCNLLVKNTFDMSTRGGKHHLRIGCEFIDLPGTRLSMIERFISRIERERKARMSGLG